MNWFDGEHSELIAMRKRIAELEALGELDPDSARELSGLRKTYRRRMDRLVSEILEREG